MSQEYECVVEEALRALDESNDQGYIDIIRMACGKPLRTIADANKEFLLDQFMQYGDVFRRSQ
jgi:hypothetical protein